MNLTKKYERNNFKKSFGILQWSFLLCCTHLKEGGEWKILSLDFAVWNIDECLSNVLEDIPTIL